MSILKKLSFVKKLQSKKVKGRIRNENTNMYTFTLTTNDKDFIDLLSQVMGKRLRIQNGK